MKQEQNSFSRLWTYLRAYRLEVFLSIFLKILSVKISGQFATIRSSRAFPPTNLRNSLGVVSGLNTYNRFDGR